MATELIYDLRRPGFPKFSNTESGFRTMIEYVGLFATLEAQQPNLNDAWGDFPGRVSSAKLEPLEGTSKGTLDVEVELLYEESNSDFGFEGSLAGIIYEVEWVVFTRSMYEHPKFRLGGGGTYALTPGDISDIQAWQDEKKTSLKEEYKYNELALTGSGSTAAVLSANAKMFARGIEIGQETYDDFAPVIRKTSTYVSGNPGTSTAGAKETPDDFSGKPTGYEWRKSADRAVRSGGKTRWDRVEEWTGAETVLSDKANIYWAAPS